MLNSFHSRVARRVFGLFFLSTVLPVVVTIVMITAISGSELQARHLDDLQQDAKHYGLAVFERLEFVAKGLDAWIDQGTRFSSLSPGVLEARFVRNIDTASLAKPPHRQLAIDRTAAQPDLLLYRGLQDGRVVLARVDWKFVWGPESAIPHDIGICMLDGSQELLLCPSEQTRRVTRELGPMIAESAVGQRVIGQDEPLLVSYWTLFLAAEFKAPGWTVVASRPKRSALSVLDDLRSWFLPAAGITVTITIWLTLIQVRRRLGPLERLRDATAKVAQGDFSTPLVLETRDEFEQLADSFNNMTAQLGRQFTALNTLGEVDRLILSNAATEDVIEQSLEFLVSSLGCETVLVALFERRAEDSAAYLRDTSGGIRRQSLVLDPAKIRTRVSGRYEWCSIGSLLPRAASDLIDLCPDRMLVFPLMIAGECSGFLAVDGDGVDETDAYWLRMTGEFCDRVAVAVASIRREAALYQQAHFDQLTGLPNRQLFKDRLDRAIESATREDHSGALLFVDLDHFKAVNDSEGHMVGDQLLIMASRRLGDHLRRADTVARLGGDEFTVLLSHIENLDEASHVADTIVSLLAEPFVIDGVEHFVGASIGIGIFPADGNSADKLLQSADTAMYQAKDKGRGTAVFFDEAMNRRVRHRRELEAELRSAINNEELELYFQPTVDLSSGAIIGAEALLRWNHPSKGLLAPGEFIGVAEETGLIAEIGDWVLASAFASFRRWHEQGLLLKTLAINVSVRQFRESRFGKRVIELARQFSIPPGLLELELTESLYIDETPALQSELRALQDNGIRLAIDDFGTGFSSLSYLERIPFDTLKIDRSFLAQLPSNIRSCAITRAVITLANTLGKRVVAEGVETAAQANFLAAEADIYAQGYLYGRPMPAAEFFEAARARAPDTVSETAMLRRIRMG